MSLNERYLKSQVADEHLWREIGVSIDSIIELEEILLSHQLKSYLEKLSLKVIKDILTLYNLEEVAEKEHAITSLTSMSLKEKQEILILRDFQNRRKQAIDKLYSVRMKDSTLQYSSSTMSKLKHLLDDSVMNILDIYTLYSWGNKGTGELYIFDDKVDFSKVKQIPTEYKDDLINELFKGAGSKKQFKIFSHSSLEDSKIIVILYKQVNDAPRPDFDRALRNKEVAPLMFCIDTKEKTIEVKSTKKTDQKSVIHYFSSTFGCSVNPIVHEQFENYEKEKVVDAFLKGQPVLKDSVEDFIVNKVVFRESPIKNSPKVTLELEDKEIWPSVQYAHENNCIDLSSIKDIETLSFKSVGKRRSIRSRVLNNGNVLFTMDDSKLDNQTKTLIAEKFHAQFGIPLNQEILNTKFNDGKADKIDYLMGTNQVGQLDQYGNDILQELLHSKVIIKSNKSHYYCTGCRLEKEITQSEPVPDVCPDCECDELKIKTIEFKFVDLQKVKTLVKDILKTLDNWTLASKDSNITFDNGSYQFLKLLNNETNDIFQVLIVNETVPTSVINRLKTMLTPTLLLCIGQQEKHISSYNSDCIQALNFGKLYISGERMFPVVFKEIISTLKVRQKSYVSNAANIGAKSLEALLVKPNEVDKKYTDKKFEDDAYTLIKDIFPNSIKWGKEMSGKAVPEGIFAISYLEQKGPNKNIVKRVFSYDCKFTRDKNGYNLKKEEQRKAVDYVEKLNNNEIINVFSDKQEISGHIFISNKFQTAQIDTMKKHFYEKLGDNSNAKPIFLTVDVLLKLFNEYRENYSQINNARNIFSKELIKLFSKEEVTLEAVGGLYKKVLNKNLQEYPELDTRTVTEFIEEDL